jgi:hypothetical protein
MRGTMHIVTLALIMLSALTASACGAPETREQASDTGPSTSLPADYMSWPKLNDVTILRGGEDEDGESDERTAVDLYANVNGDLDPGSILVKQTRLMNGDTPGALSMIGVMRRIGGSRDGGWSFEAYDPRTMTIADSDVGTCVNCHSLQTDNDYLFSDRDTVLSANPAPASDGPPGF